MTLTDVGAKVRALEADHARVCQQIEEEELAVQLAAADEYAATEARVILQYVSQEVQQQAHHKISSVVEKCLAAVFDDPLDFQIVFDRKRGRTEARLVFSREGNEVHTKMGLAGGMIEVAAFALRVACLLLTKPALRPLLVVDEPFKSVHGDANRERLRGLLEVLPDQLGIQIICVTGLEWLRTGKIVEMKR